MELLERRYILLCLMINYLSYSASLCILHRPSSIGLRYDEKSEEEESVC